MHAQSRQGCASRAGWRRVLRQCASVGWDSLRGPTALRCTTGNMRARPGGPQAFRGASCDWLAVQPPCGGKDGRNCYPPGSRRVAAGRCGSAWRCACRPGGPPFADPPHPGARRRKHCTHSRWPASLSWRKLRSAGGQPTMVEQVTPCIPQPGPAALPWQTRWAMQTGPAPRARRLSAGRRSWKHSSEQPVAFLEA